MQRFTRSSAFSFTSALRQSQSQCQSLRSVGAVRFKTDSTSVGNDPDAALKKSHDDAISDGKTAEPMSEGHSLDRTNDARRAQDSHTEELTKAKEQRDGQGMSPSNVDAINLAHGESTGAGEKQRKENATPEGQAFQPGQKGEQIGGMGGRQEGEGMGSTERPAGNTTFSSLGDFAKNVVGRGPSNGFHTYARLRFPDPADKGARKPKDTGVGAEQTPHLPHHNAGEGDKMPAVKDNASLPSKKGNVDDKKKQPAKAFSTYARQSYPSETNTGKGPGSEARPTGTADTPGSRAVDPNSGTHSPSFAPKTGPSATYTHVRGNPEPDSYQEKYEFAETTSNGAVPSGSAPRSSTSTSTYYTNTTNDLPQNEAGIGSSSKMIRDSLKGADEMVAQMDAANSTADKRGAGGVEPGQAGTDAGRGEAVGEVGGRNQPPDVGTIPEDTLPKPIKQ